MSGEQDFQKLFAEKDSEEVEVLLQLTDCSQLMDQVYLPQPPPAPPPSSQEHSHLIVAEVAGLV